MDRGSGGADNKVGQHGRHRTSKRRGELSFFDCLAATEKSALASPSGNHCDGRIDIWKIQMGTNSRLGLIGTLAASMMWGLQAHAADVDAAIVFAVDFSSSVDPDTADLQREGHAAAITSPEIIAAIARNHVGCISIVYFEWSSSGRMRKVLPWTSVCGLEDAEAAASVIRKKGDTGRGRRGRRGGTSISYAIDVGSLLLDKFPGTATRKIIDISANGENNGGPPVHQSRLKAIAKGYTVNAISLPSTDGSSHNLASYFTENVIGGPLAFVITPTGASDYAVALRRKLVIEISLNVNAPGQSDN
jgi:hypothetical protein